MIQLKKAETDDELQGILSLQKQNLPTALNETEIRSQGFVTVQHSLADLQKLNDIEKHIIAKDGEAVEAYLLAMTEQSQHEIPVLIPMFQQFRQIPLGGKTIADFRYLVVGQVCVAKRYRGTGLLGQCYQFYRETYQPFYDFAITEIDAGNLRSINAHKRVGFQEIYRYPAINGVEWVIVLWDWNLLFASVDFALGQLD